MPQSRTISVDVNVDPELMALTDTISGSMFTPRVINEGDSDHFSPKDMKVVQKVRCVNLYGIYVLAMEVFTLSLKGVELRPSPHRISR